METFLTFCSWLFLTIFLILSCPTVISAATITTTTFKPGSLVVELINRDSPLSPFYDPNITIYDRDKWALQSSIRRHAYLSGNRRNASTEAISGELTPDSNGAGYLAKLSIGTPPIEAYFILDTGSDLLWTQCEPCLQCYKQPGPIYDPFKSSTYDSIECSSPYCRDIPIRRRGCDSSNRCTYIYTYGDGSYSIGSLAYETVQLKASNGNVATIDNVAFGCGNRNNLTFPGGDSGVLGLSVGGISLISQLSHAFKREFSYCFGNISNTNSKGNLVLGDGAFINGNTTPMDIGPNGFYYLTLEGISVADLKLDIKPGTFDRRPDGSGGLVIDSGTHYTLLAIDPYLKLRRAIFEELSDFDANEVPDPEEMLRTCYEGVVSTDLQGFPPVTFHFKGGADVVLERWSTFVQATEDVFCMAFLFVSAGSISVFGNFAQQFHNVGYDIQSSIVSFQNIDCLLL